LQEESDARRAFGWLAAAPVGDSTGNPQFPGEPKLDATDPKAI
jgi:hypothetical protein